MATDDLNRAALEALMRAKGIDGYADLARRSKLDRTYVSRIMRGQRPAQPSTIVAFAQAVRESTLAITGTGIDISIADLVDEAS
jgi:transcriptional regulator with XRE-family HTH domain